MTRVSCNAVLPGVEIGEDQHIGLALQARVHDHALAGDKRERGVGLHFAVDFEVGRALLQKAQGFAHFQRRGRVGGAKVGMRD